MMGAVTHLFLVVQTIPNIKIISERDYIMKLNRLASAVAILAAGLASAAWSQVIDPAGGVTVTPQVKDADGNITTPYSVATTPLTNPANPTNPASFGMQTGTGATAPVQGTIGGPGGVSGVFNSYNRDITVMASAGTGLLNSAHDFTSNALEGAPSVGLCTFCHTPHKAASTLLLWNHTLSKNTFAWDVAATTAGTALPAFAGNVYTGPSAKCLSCHDGSVSIGDVGWFSGGGRVGLGASLNPSGIGVIYQVGKKGNMSGTHPVAIPYPLNGAPNVYNGSTTGARLATNDFIPDPTGNNIRLYSDLGGGQIVGKVTAGQTGIECTSCHDPHNKAANDVYFLRGKLTGATVADGYLCLQCHVK